MKEKNNLDTYTGILFELKIGLNKENAIVIDYGGKPVGKVREALKGYSSKALNQIQELAESAVSEKVKLDANKDLSCCIIF